MVALNARARATGDWLGAARTLIPKYCDHFSSFARADTQFMWPTTSRSRILDAGSMWGAISIPAAQFHAEVYAVDKTIETLSFQSIRAAQEGLQNIRIAASPLSQLPFADDFFDLVVLSGVLEWVALEQNAVLEKEWGKFGRGFRPVDRKRYEDTPTASQLKVLREVRRVLKPDGSLYLAIENRIGYPYLFGWPDDHVNLPFVGLLPRRLANLVTRLLLKNDYRTYVYTIRGYKKLLQAAGLRAERIYGAFSHYINPQEVIPLGMVRSLAKRIRASKGRLHRLMLTCTPARLLPLLAPSVIVLAAKDRTSREPRLIQILRQARVVQTSELDQVQIIKSESREGNDLTAHFVVYEDGRPHAFVKVCRSHSATEALQREAPNLRVVTAALRGTAIEHKIPRMLACDTVDGVTFMATSFMEVDDLGFHGKLDRRSVELLDRGIEEAARFLAVFQKSTTSSVVDAVPHLSRVVQDQRRELMKRGVFSDQIDEKIQLLADDIRSLQSTRLPVCAQHGDFDFFRNIVFGRDGIRVVDFEHFELKALPFLDVATLIFHPIFLSDDYSDGGKDLAAVIAKRDLSGYIEKWLRMYGMAIGLDQRLVGLALPLAALEQNAKSYPASRQRSSFPFMGDRALLQALSFRLTNAHWRLAT